MEQEKFVDKIRITGFQLYAIDFGLSFVSKLAEDKAVDMYVLKRALTSTHPGSEKLVSYFVRISLVWYFAWTIFKRS